MLYQKWKGWGCRSVDECPWIQTSLYWKKKIRYEFKCIMELKKERVHKFGSIEVIGFMSSQEKKHWNKQEQSLRNLWDTTKRSIFMSLESRKRRKNCGTLLWEEIMAETSLDLINDISLDSRGTENPKQNKLKEINILVPQNKTAGN